MHEPIAMRVIHLLLMSAGSAAACAEGGIELRQPVGQTMVTSSPSRPQDTGRENAAPPEKAPAGVDEYITGEGTGPCGMDPLPMIEFAFASTDLGEPQTLELRRMAGCLTAAPYETASVVLIGYADVIGTIPANLALGFERAQAVMRQLIDGGVSAGRIVVASAGEAQRPHARRGLRARRVEILIARGGPPRPDEAPIARGIDAEGLLPRPRRPVVSGVPPQRLLPSPGPIMPGTPPGRFPPPYVRGSQRR